MKDPTMGIGMRVMLVEGDRITRITRVPARRFERLTEGDPHEAMPEFAGQRVRCAVVYVELFQRKPMVIAHVDWIVLPFDRHGRLNRKERRRHEALAAEMVGGALIGAEKGVVKLGPYLAAKRFRTEFKWDPTDEQFRTLVKLALDL